MKIFDRYILKNLAVASVFIATTLAVVILLTQSLRFLELVIEAGASSSAFWILTLLALPRFLEVILPLSMMAATLFVYNRMIGDSEMVVARAAGYSPSALARPALFLSLIVTLLLLGITTWIAPKSLSHMQEMRQMIKAQFSTLLFREGVFNKIGPGLTLYVRDRADDGTLKGLMIHDSRESDTPPSSVMAKRGALVALDNGFQIVVYDGTRQQYDPANGILQRLNFNSYSIDLPENDTIKQRWAKPDERTILELFNPDNTVIKDRDNRREFNIEIHRRLISPVLCIVFTLIACAALLVGPVDRRGQVWRIVMGVMAVVLIQGLYIASYNLARQHDMGVVLMYILVLAPLGLTMFFLSEWSEHFRRRLFFSRHNTSSAGGLT